MQVQLVGILNVTPDSFSDGGLFETPSEALAHAEQLFADRADILDVGAESTNPKKTEAPLTSDQELQRLLPIVRELILAHPSKVSIDSYHPETIAAIAEEFGADFIANDVTGMNDPMMRTVVSQYGLRCFISHLPAKFGTDIQAAHQDGKIDDIQIVLNELLTRRQELLDLGLSADKIVLDPGIGFGKTMRLNWELLSFAKLAPGIPVMIGYSRKRFLATDPASGQTLNGVDRYSAEMNLAAARIAISAGAAYLRVHDVAAHNRLH